LKSYNSTMSNISGLLKVNKADGPLRPFVCRINLPTFNLSKFYYTMFGSVTTSFVKDSLDSYYIKVHFHLFLLMLFHCLRT
jgi:hypothetical protein